MSQPLPVVRCADITPAPVSWLWEPYLARGKLAVLDGDPGTGKSFVTTDLAARVSRGTPMPGGTPPERAGVVLLLNAEDDAADTIRPRVAAAGGDPDRVRILAAPGLGLDRLPQFPDDVPALEAAVRESAAVLVVIDPMMAFLPPTVSANNDQCIRTALTPLAAIAAATDACVLLVRHLRKHGGAAALYRGAGSIGIVGAARTGLVIARHPDDPDLRVLATHKTNVGVPGPSLGFRLVQREGGQAVEWTGRLDLTADDLLGAGAPLRAGRHSRERAAEWLRQFLADGPRKVAELKEAAAGAGIAWRTLERVKESLGFRSEAVRTGDRTEWQWRDPGVKEDLGSDLPPLDWLDEFAKLGARSASRRG